MATRTISVARGGPEETAACAAQLIVAMQVDRPLAPSTRHLLTGVDQVVIARGAGPRRSGRRLECLLPDPAMSSSHARMISVHGRWAIEDAGSKNGTFVNGEPVKRAAVLADGDLVEVGHTLLLYRDARPPLPGPADLAADALVAPAPGLETFVAELASAGDELARVAPATLPVLLLGESGTGKEVVARALHRLSGRPGRFVAVNCAALPDNLVESELFGVRKGAFTGATEDRPGHVRSAEGGTLFLDEIGDLPAAAQAVLLRVLQEREVVPIGSSRPVELDVRFVAATNHDLAGRVAEGSFRRDLLARLAGFTMTLPPLAERREDLGLLAAALLRRVAAKPEQVKLTVAAARALFAYEWPANVRELELALSAATTLAGARAIEVAHLPAALRSPPVAAPPAALTDEDQRLRDEVVAALREHGGNVAAVARVMGKGRMQIHRWVRRFGLDLRSYRR